MLSHSVIAQFSDDLICKNLNLTTSCEEEGKYSTWEDALKNHKSVALFYSQVNCQALWFRDGETSQRAIEAMDLIRNSANQGLNPLDYRIEELELLLKSMQGQPNEQISAFPEDIAQFDLLLTDALISMMDDMRFGEQRDYKQGWSIGNENPFLLGELLNAYTTHLLTPFIDGLAPSHPQYRLLQSAYLEYKNSINDTLLPELTSKPVLGDSSEAVILFRERLSSFLTLDEAPNHFVIDTTSEQLKRYNEDSSYALIDTLYFAIDSSYQAAYFDTTLRSNLVKFQEIHGLETDGEIGSRTLRELNKGDVERLRQIEINLERWRWCNRNWGDEHLLVNIPGYELFGFKEDSLSLQKTVVVGRKYTPTVVFQNMMRFVELNPYWNVPYSISSREILPKLQEDPDYVVRNQMQIFSGNKKVDPYSVDWSLVSSNSFPYTIRQDPGPINALGTVKFLFPNEYSIYLHDTQAKKFFAETHRAYSHGCVRVEKPMELTAYLFQNDNKWSQKKIDKIMEQAKNKRIELDVPIPIYLLYFTTWVDQNGELRFLKDIYNRDATMLEFDD